MIKIKKMLRLSISIMIAIFMVSCGGEAKSSDSSSTTEAKASSSSSSVEEKKETTITMTLGHVVAEGTPLDLGDHYFADKVAEMTDGRILIEVYPNSALGDNRAMLESLQMGTIDMMSPAVAAVGGFTDQTLIFDLPYLFKNDAHAEAVLDGTIGAAVFDALEESGMHGLSWEFQGWRELSANKEVRHPDDLKGIKIRTQNNEIQIASWNNLGASAVPMSFSEVLTSLQQGVLDAQENPVSNIYLSGFYEAQKYIIMTNHIYDPCPLLMSKKVWDKLSKEDQAILSEAAQEAAEYERKIANSMDAEFSQKIADSGKSSIITLTDEERQVFRDMSQPIYDKYASKIGQDKIDKIEEMADQF